MKIRPYAFSYDVEWGYNEPLSIQVLETPEATVLFGGGMSDCADQIAEIALDHGADVLVVEHGDIDHYEGVPKIREHHPEIEVAVPTGDAHELTEEGIEVDHLLEAGTTYWGIRTVAAPGHTPDNMSYVFEDVLVAGDTVAGIDSEFAADDTGESAFTICVDAYNSDTEQAKESVSNLLEHSFDAVLVSHGTNVTEGGYLEIEQLASMLSQ